MKLCKRLVELAEDVTLRGHSKESVSFELRRHSLGCIWCGNLIDADPLLARRTLEWGIDLLEAEKEENKP